MKAICISPAAGRWLDTSSSCSVIHVFARACNLISDQGEILSLVGADLGPGPFTVVCDLPQAFTWPIIAASSACVAGTTIQIGRLIIETAGSPIWDPVPDWSRLRRNQHYLFSHLPTIREALAARPNINTELSTHIDAALTQAANTLLGGIHADDEVVYRMGARGLAGLGTGLTPSGDDFLMGVIFALWATRSEAEATSIASTIAEAAGVRTTALSRAWLQAAAHGEAIQPWHDLVGSLAGADRSSVSDAIVRIMSIGHRSGMEALAGFAAVLANRR